MSLPDDLQALDAALRRDRPALSEDRLDRLAARARARARGGAPVRRPRGMFLRSRLALTAMLVLGFGFSGAGAGLAVSGLVGDADQAATAQYGENPPGSGGETLGGGGGGGAGGGAGGERPGGDAGGRPAGGEAAPVQETRQLGADAQGSLPATGWGAIPVILIGVALIVTALALRRSDPRTGVR